tara:strand:+ start:270 stop:1943 length:1674 start_codon:yes stop_codon:yes gene_type:complete
LLLLLLIVSFIYLHFIIYGGYGSGDDIPLVLTSLNIPSVIHWIKSILLGSGAARPISSVILVLVHILFKNNPSLYIISGILSWLLSVFLLCFILKNFMDANSIYIFALLASFPFFTTTIFSGPYLFTQFVVPIIFWSLSLISLLTHAKRRSLLYYFFGWFLLALSLLTLSYILPLLSVTAFLPIIVEYCEETHDRKNDLIRLMLKYTIPVLLISIMFLVFKIYLVKLYTPVNYVYGLADINIISVLQSLYYFWVIFIEIPLMLVEVIPHMLNWKVLILSGMIIFYFIILKHSFNNYVQTYTKSRSLFKEKLFISLVIFALISSASIFFISHYPSSTFGYYNRMMIPSFIMYTVFISWLFNKLLDTYWFFVPIVISILWCSSMIIQLDNFIKSWEIRENIAKEITIKLNDADLGNEPILIANMPYFLKSNYNNEEVTFCTWAFDAELQLVGAKKIKSWPVSYRILMDPFFYPNHNILNKLSVISDDANIWYYEYEEGSEKSMFKQLGDKKAMFDKFEEIKEKKINYHPIILREKIRLAFKKLPLVWSIYKRNLPGEIK